MVTLLRDIRDAVERATGSRAGVARRRPAPPPEGWLDGAMPHRGEVWLADLAPAGRVAPVVLLQPEDGPGAGDAVVAARVVRGTGDGPHRIRLRPEDGMPGACSVNAGRLVTVELTTLVRPVATLTPRTMSEIEAALMAVLGIGVVAATGAPQLLPPPRSHLPDPGSRPRPEAVPDDRPPRRLEDHPMARLFGQSPPPHPLAAAPPPAAAEVAALLPELRALVQRRLHRSAPRLQLVLDEAAADGRSVEWVAAAVRATPVRGVMQSSLDEIADEMLEVAGRRDR